MSQYSTEVATGERFEFGENWARYLRTLDDEKIEDAITSLKNSLEVESLAGKSFLDIGSGSGLFSLAARRLGARVHSFDYDPQSVACTTELKQRYFPDDDSWTVEAGSALDRAYLNSLGQFDVVYSWGVLHHTGDMWTALAYAALPVAEGGKLFIAIYNDQGTASRRWKKVKKLYNRLPRACRFLVVWPSFWVLNWRSMVKDLLRGKPFRTIRDYGKNRNIRGMTSFWRNLNDWVGGYPFEVAKPGQIFDFYRERGFILTKLRTCGGSLGNNEFVFEKRYK
ncbi:MAG TPA: class I SAM-dependent methyltransferase [Candidatus Eisenbacteria bacterium]|nr:class I SAM-dependent methyltransferase [Candidatus Eisenbacteria bacterium]